MAISSASGLLAIQKYILNANPVLMIFNTSRRRLMLEQTSLSHSCFTITQSSMSGLMIAERQVLHARSFLGSCPFLVMKDSISKTTIGNL